MTMTDKVTPKSMEDQYNHQLETFKRKNHDYGNSFEKSLDTFGLVAGIVRMSDKFERLVSLNDPSKGAQIASESLVDTLEDLSNYAAMAACWLKGKKAADWKELRLKELDGNIENIVKKADTSVVNTKGDLHINSAGGTSSVDIKTGKIEFHPQFSGIHLKGPEKLELDLNVDRETFDKVMGDIRHPSNLPKNPPVKVQYGHIGMFEFPDGMDTIASYLQQLNHEEAKKKNDRVMLDMMLSRIEKGEVVRIVANGDGSFTTYFEKGKKTLNEIRKEHGFDPVNGEDNEG